MKRTTIALAVIFSVCIPAQLLAAENELSFEQMLQRVLDSYPSLQVAARQVERARLENNRIESQLGWNLGARAGFSRDLSLIGAPTDRSEVSASLQRRLSTGASVGLEGGYAHEDASATLSPAFPNPVTTGRLDLSWRQPLLKGAGNPDYKLGIASADAGSVIAESDRRALRDQVTSQLAGIFYNAASTRARIRNAENAIVRTGRLKKYIQDRSLLGLVEEKDLLQADAQLAARQAERDALLVIWNQQAASLNRLMGRPWDESFVPVAASVHEAADDQATSLKLAEDNSPDIMRNRARLSLADAAIARSRDAARDSLDVVFSVGNRTRSGDTTVGAAVDDSEMVGGVRVEYARALDRRGYEAELSQAQLDRDIALREIGKAQDDLRYNVSGLLSEIDATDNALKSYRDSLAREQAKLAEAERRYRRGRTETDRLIQYETELTFADLSVELQTIELARRHMALDLYEGTLWQRVIPATGASGERQ